MGKEVSVVISALCAHAHSYTAQTSLFTRVQFLGFSCTLKSADVGKRDMGKGTDEAGASTSL